MIRETLQTWLIPLFILVALFLGLYAVGSATDAILLHFGQLDNTLYLSILPSSPDAARAIMGSLIEFMAGLVGLGMTVATILVQLSANRYSSRVIDLFMADPVNIAYFALAIVAPLYAFWVTNLLATLPYPTTHIFLVWILISLNMLLLIPYVNHLFTNIKPEAIIRRIRYSIDPSRLGNNPSNREVVKMGQNLVTSVNQLTDVVLNSVSNSDINLALRTVVALKQVACDTLHYKGKAPPLWFEPPQEVFVGPAAQLITRMDDKTAWVEMHTIKQMELIFVQSLGNYQELTSAIVLRTREITQKAIEVNDRKVVRICTLFFNTYLRHALNRSDLRTIFHAFYQYRLIGESCLDAGQDAILKEIGFYFKYYGQECEKKGMGFAIEIAASDLRVLIEKAYNKASPITEELLKVFLEVDRVPEVEDQDMGQRGVRKSQAILAAFFLSKGEEALARRIFKDMGDERVERIRSIKDELEAGTSQDFWEIQERGSNFYHIPLELAPYLDTFFNWFHRPSIPHRLV